MIAAPPETAPRVASGWRLAAALLSGMLLSAAFPPLDFGFLAWVAILPLLWSLDGARPREAVGRGYVAGLAAMAGIGFFTTSFGEGVLWMALLPWVLFTAIEALFFIPVALAIAAILNGDRAWGILLGAPAVWVLGEWLRGVGLLGFPFGYLGYALHAETFAIQPAALGGVYLVSGMAALASASLFLILFRGRDARRAGFAGLSVITATVIWGMGVVSSGQVRGLLGGPSASVVVAQGDARREWDDPDVLPAFERLQSNTLAAVRSAGQKVDLIVWSESSVPFFHGSVPFLDRQIVRLTRRANAPLLTGALRRDAQGVANTAVLLGPDGAEAGSYQKRRLVPFGEWVPFRHVLPLLNNFGVVPEDEVPGRAWTVLQHGSLRLGVPICFESAAPEISRAFTRNGANLLVVITNDAWFGHTGMAEQHANVAALRAVETGRWVVRCGLTGVSGFISPTGAWQDRLLVDHAGAAVGSVALVSTVTPYVRYGDWFLWVCGFLAILPMLGWRIPLSTPR